MSRLPWSAVQPPRPLGFGYRDGARGADLDTALAPEAFILVHHDGLVVLHLEDAHGTHIDALFIAELKLLVKGQPWWWYAVAIGLVLCAVFVPVVVAIAALTLLGVGLVLR